MLYFGGERVDGSQQFQMTFQPPSAFGKKRKKYLLRGENINDVNFSNERVVTGT